MNSNHKITGMYDIKNMDKGLTSSEQRELERYVDSGNLFRQNKDIFKEKEKNFKTCLRYNPCPICNKCLNKASHLYVKCQNCMIPICTHKFQDRMNMIRRDNFEVKIDKNTIEHIRKLAKQVEMK